MPALAARGAHAVSTLQPRRYPVTDPRSAAQGLKLAGRPAGCRTARLPTGGVCAAFREHDALACALVAGKLLGSALQLRGPSSGVHQGTPSTTPPLTPPGDHAGSMVAATQLRRRSPPRAFDLRQIAFSVEFESYLEHDAQGSPSFAHDRIGSRHVDGVDAHVLYRNRGSAVWRLWRLCARRCPLAYLRFWHLDSWQCSGQMGSDHVARTRRPSELRIDDRAGPGARRRGFSVLAFAMGSLQL